MSTRARHKPWFGSRRRLMSLDAIDIEASLRQLFCNDDYYVEMRRDEEAGLTATVRWRGFVLIDLRYAVTVE